MEDQLVAIEHDAGRLPGFVIDNRVVAIHLLVPTRALDEALTYLLPGKLVEQAQVGSIVEIPLGKSTRLGVITSLDASKPAGIKLRSVERVISEHPPLSKNLLSLADWICKQYGCAYAVALSLVIGPKLAATARASEVPSRVRKLSVKRIVNTVDGIQLTSRQRNIANQIPVSWVSVADICKRLSTTRTTIGKLAEAGILLMEDRYVDELQDVSVEEVPTVVIQKSEGVSLRQLTKAQEDAVQECLNADPATLLVGVTGSGKTEVYLEAIAAVLKQGKGAIVLVPEIALTPQTARRFTVRFPNDVEVLHSGMTKSQRALAHERISAGKSRVVVGPRSAIFAPVQALGMIVIDEEHDGSYKQDSEPRYDARRVAFKRAQIEEAKLVLGSATPRPESWAGIKHRVILKERPAGGRLAPVKLVDIREHEEEFPLTKPVRNAIASTLERDHKVIILHNRRGYANALHCKECATTVRCPRCDVSLVIHGYVAKRQRLLCHHCGLDRQIPEACEVCGSSQIVRLGSGTEQLEKLLDASFEAPIFRLDADAVKTRGAVGEILEQFANCDGAAILVGTQMVAKGHDFPDVELGVVIDADAALAIPDFRAEERAFSLVAQLAGRAGRSSRTSEHALVLVQTRNPQLACIKLAANHDVEGFLAREISGRLEHGWPPAQRLVRVLISARSKPLRDHWARAVADGINRLQVGEVLGPASLMRINDRERSQVLIPTTQVIEVASAMRRFLTRTTAERAKNDLRIMLDVDPQTLV